MKLEAISHRSALTDCYAWNEDEVVLNIRTGKDITAVCVIHGDPYSRGCMGFGTWSGEAAVMERSMELAQHQLWTIRLRPPYKREQYYFEITAGKETILYFEDGFCTKEETRKSGRIPQYFKFPWLNPSDVCKTPEWVRDVVWYQIFPDRFRRGGHWEKRMKLRKWEDASHISYKDYYGGDLPGITEKLEYLRDLGITGIYLTPVFLSDSNHKYNTFDYEQIDPDFGTEADMIAMVKKAHSLGIRVMLDAVFNHSGTAFAPWQDVLKNGKESPYYDWFFVNRDPLKDKMTGTEDGRYFSFAFQRYMPKLNTGNPAVADYFVKRCRYWVEQWGIDGIRFDVGNEVSHTFLKHCRREIKRDHPEIYLLGEIWHDAVQWLQGDEYDSVMHYPLLESIHNFWVDENATARQLAYSLNRCYSLYPEQVNRVLFNFLDTHDTARAITRCGDLDRFYQQLTILLTMPGSPCLYYGTEIALEGGPDPDCRRPMPWHRIEAGQCEAELQQTRQLVALRHHYDQLRSSRIRWKYDENNPRLICFGRGEQGEKTVLTVYLNAGTEAVVIGTDGTVCHSRGYADGILQPGGILVQEQDAFLWE